MLILSLTVPKLVTRSCKVMRGALKQMWW